MSFATIKGQDKALKILKGYFQQERLAGGYLFTGPEGVGKTCRYYAGQGVELPGRGFPALR